MKKYTYVYLLRRKTGYFKISNYLLLEIIVQILVDIHMIMEEAYLFNEQDHNLPWQIEAQHLNE